MKKTTLINLNIAILLLLIAIPVIFPYKIETVNAVETSAKAMCVMEKDSKRVIYSKNMDSSLPMASTTKIVTAITVIQNCKDLEEYVQIDDSAVGVEGSSIYLRKGETMRVKDLLYGLMLRSGNDSAVALACYLSGNVTKFAQLMNETATKLGCKNSHFDNPHGLDSATHYTSAYDLALITSYALNNPIFAQIVSTKTHVVEATNKTDKRYFTNKNKLLSTLNGCTGVKTGYTKKAGRCLVSSCKRENTEYVCVVLNCGPMFEESCELLNYALKNYKNIKIIDKNREIYNEYLTNSNNNRLYLYANQDFYYPLTDEEKSNVIIKYSINVKQANQGEQVGEINIFFKNDLIKTLKLYTMNKIDKLIESNELNSSSILWEEKLNEDK